MSCLFNYPTHKLLKGLFFGRDALQLAFPNGNHSPTVATELAYLSPIALYIVAKFLRPKRATSFW